MIFDIGDDAVITADFLVGTAKTLTDPSALTIRIKPPTLPEYSYTAGVDSELVHVSTGKYSVVVDCTEAGEWKYRWKSTGATAKGAEEGTFTVRPSMFDSP